MRDLTAVRWQARAAALADEQLAIEKVVLHAAAIRPGAKGSPTTPSSLGIG